MYINFSLFNCFICFHATTFLYILLGKNWCSLLLLFIKSNTFNTDNLNLDVYSFVFRLKFKSIKCNQRSRYWCWSIVHDWKNYNSVNAWSTSVLFLAFNLVKVFMEWLEIIFFFASRKNWCNPLRTKIPFWKCHTLFFI